jgi:hypothetical protein
MTGQPALGEHDLVALRTDLPTHGLVAGDGGAVVFVHGAGEADEVEFATADGRTIALETLSADRLEPIAGPYVLHARRLPAVYVRALVESREEQLTERVSVGALNWKHSALRPPSGEGDTLPTRDEKRSSATSRRMARRPAPIRTQARKITS